MKYLAIICLAFLPVTIIAQTDYDVDALRYSQNDIAGTARGLGVAGAFSSVGADMSSLSTNPAGLGLYRSSEISFSPSVIHFKSSSDYLGTANQADNARFYINNFGAVFTKMKGKDSKQKMIGSAFAISINRLNNFNNEIHMKGLNDRNSITDAYVEEVNGTPGNEVTSQNFSFESALAYDGWLVNEINFSSLYRTPIQGTIEQEINWTTKGGLDEVSMGLGANYDNLIYFGGALAFPFLNYESDYTLMETDINDEIPVFESMELNQRYTATGFGFNAKFGLIVRPNNWLRIGAAVQTPNYMSITEEYFSSLTAEFDTVSYENLRSPFGTFDYQLRLPWKLTGGASFFIKKSGFISVDYEFVDYKSDKFDFGTGNSEFESRVNNIVDSKYRATSTIRIGGEYAKKIFRLRAGYAYSMSPFKKNVAASNADFSRQYYTAGLGVRKEKISVDFAYVRSHTKEYFSPYSLSDGSEPFSLNEVNKDNMVLTLGYRF